MPGTEGGGGAGEGTIGEEPLPLLSVSLERRKSNVLPAAFSFSHTAAGNGSVFFSFERYFFLPYAKQSSKAGDTLTRWKLKRERERGRTSQLMGVNSSHWSLNLVECKRIPSGAYTASRGTFVFSQGGSNCLYFGLSVISFTVALIGDRWGG